MQTIFYYLARVLIALIQALPLTCVARLGRIGGRTVYALDGRHRKVALKNLAMCFGQEKTQAEITAMAKENFRRIGENFACAIKTAGMTDEQLKPHLSLITPPNIAERFARPGDNRITVAIGHFGNFELYARCTWIARGVPSATTYRGLKQPGFNRLLTSLRNKSGCRFFERRDEGAELKAFMNQPRVVLGLLADQSAGGNRLRLPFFGHPASTSSAPAVFALRYGCDLYTAICYRTSLAHWQVELGQSIPTHDANGPRSIADIMTDVNLAFEAAVRRDPANWFWVHNRWKVPRIKPGQTVEPDQAELENPPM
jgi:KDO2-lipid IV(A) lauroyltransferase